MTAAGRHETRERGGSDGTHRTTHHRRSRARGFAPITLNGVNPQAYFTDLLTRLVNGWPQKRIDELMPWFWAPEQPP